MYKILGIGNAICDLLARINDDFLKRFDLAKGSMSLSSEEQMQAILSALQKDNISIKRASGGSIANSIMYLQKFGLNTAFLGNAAFENYGIGYVKEMEDAGVKFINIHNGQEIGDTAKSIILISDDGERSMCTYLGCAADFHEKIIDFDAISQAEILYIEGYLWDNGESVPSFIKIIDFARNKGKKIAFSLSDSFCVSRHLADFQALAKEKTDILFANEAEILALLELDILEQKSLEIIQNFVKKSQIEILAITRNSAGSVIITKDEIIEVSTKKVTPLDSTGAGDAFAAGFLYGLSQHFSYYDSARIANFTAGQVVAAFGARPDIKMARKVSEVV